MFLVDKAKRWSSFRTKNKHRIFSEDLCSEGLPLVQLNCFALNPEYCG